MAEKNKTTNFGFGEIGTIRDILMGEQISEFKNRFDDLEGRSKKADAELKKDLEALTGKTDKSIDKMEEKIMKRLDKMEQQFRDQLKKLEEKIDSVKKEDRQRLGNALADLSKKILKD